MSLCLWGGLLYVNGSDPNIPNMQTLILGLLAAPLLQFPTPPVLLLAAPADGPG